MSEPAEALRKSWLQMLAHERRASPHTLRAYGDDVSTFLGFQAGHVGGAANPNGSRNDIAGIYSARRNVLGLMPHPENLIDPLVGGVDGRALFDSLAAA